MILVTGAGGKTGKALLQPLAKVEGVRAFVRSEEHVPVLTSLGAEKVIVGDLRDADAVRVAMEGMRAVYHICPNMSPHEAVIGMLVIGEAKKAGVQHFVYHSVLHPQPRMMPHHWAKLQVEEMLLDSGLPCTILQPAPYMQNLLVSWKSIVKDGVIRVPYSVGAILSFLDLGDLADAARIVLIEPGHLHATYELAGTHPMSHVDVAEAFSRVLGQKIHAETEEIEHWRLRAAPGMSEYAIESLVKMFNYYDRWGLPGNPNVLRWILKREPTSFDQLLEEMAGKSESFPYF